MIAAAVPDTDFDRLTATRLVIRRFAAGDVEAFTRYRSDPIVARYQSWDVPYPRATAEQFISSLAEAHPDTPGEWFQFAVADRATDVLVGDVAAHVHADDPRLVTIGVTFARDHHGRGYAHEALQQLLGYLFIDRGKHRVAAECDIRNAAAISLLERLGFRREAHHVESSWYKGEWTSEYGYALLAREFTATSDGSP